MVRCLKVFVTSRRKAGLNDQSNNFGALPSHSTQVRVPTGPNLLDATPAHENPIQPKVEPTSFVILLLLVSS